MVRTYIYIYIHSVYIYVYTYSRSGISHNILLAMQSKWPLETRAPGGIVAGWCRSTWTAERSWLIDFPQSGRVTSEQQLTSTKSERQANGRVPQQNGKLLQ